MCITFLGRTLKLSLFPEFEKEEKLNLENCENQSSVKKSSVRKMMACAQQDHRFFKQKLLFACFETKIIHKIVVSDFWKYNKSMDVSSLKNGDIFWIPPREYLQN